MDCAAPATMSRAEKIAGLHIQGATKCTLAALQRRYVALGAIEVPSLCIVDEISLCTTQDFHTLLELRKLGCALCLIGDPSSQLNAIGDLWHGADLTGDTSDTAMLRSVVDCQRCVFTEPRRCDARLFAGVELVPVPPHAPQGHCAGAEGEAAPREASARSLAGRRGAAGTKGFVLARHAPHCLHGADDAGHSQFHAARVRALGQ